MEVVMLVVRGQVGARAEVSGCIVGLIGRDDSMLFVLVVVIAGNYSAMIQVVAESVVVMVVVALVRRGSHMVLMEMSASAEQWVDAATSGASVGAQRAARASARGRGRAAGNGAAKRQVGVAAAGVLQGHMLLLLVVVVVVEHDTWRRVILQSDRRSAAYMGTDQTRPIAAGRICRPIARQLGLAGRRREAQILPSVLVVPVESIVGVASIGRVIGANGLGVDARRLAALSTVADGVRLVDERF